MSYKVKLNIFEGPMDLLLFLIKKEKIDIQDIPIAKVTKQYMEYLNLMEMLDLEVAGEFLVVAATLMYIKSKMLLPKDEELEEEEDEGDPRDELVRKLLEYKKFKDAAGQLKEMHTKTKGMFFRTGEGGGQKVISEDGTEYFEASLFDLITSFKKVLETVPKEVFHEVIKNKYTVNDKINLIYNLLSRQAKVYFLALFKETQTKEEAIVLFLSILELIKMNEILIVQQDSFGEIEIIRNPEIVKGGDSNESE